MKKPVSGKLILIIAGAVLGTAVIAALLTFIIMYAKPISEAWTLNVEENEFTCHIGDEVKAEYSFASVSDRSLFSKIQAAKQKKLVFTSSDTAVAEVSENGNIRAVGEGDAVITLSVSDIEETITVHSFIAGESLSFSEDSYELDSGDRLKTDMVLEPENAVLFDEITYSSSDEKVVTISKNGTITAQGPGTATITVEADALVGEASVTVCQPMTGIAFQDLSDETVMIERGESRAFTVVFYPENTTDDKEVIYTLSDDSVGTVDGEGNFTATGRGEVTLQAVCGDFTASASVFVTVTLQDISIPHEEAALAYPEGDTLKVTAVPGDTTDELTAVYSSSDESVVTVDADGNVSAVGGGTATVTASANGFSKSCVYTVSVPVTSVAISSGAMELTTGSGGKLNASVCPSFTTEDTSITWTSDNPAVASVDASGNVSANAAGAAVIRASHGSFQAACTVTVKDPQTWETTADAIIAFGKQFLGTRYVFGGTSLTGGIDCSSFVQQCFATQGIYLARTSAVQATQGTAIPADASQWRKGDLLFYTNSRGVVHHVAIYIGNGQVLQSAESQGGVVITGYNYIGEVPTIVRRYF